jgi:hypothetical protein
VSTAIRYYSVVLPLHSHSIISSDRNALNSVHKFFLDTMKNRLPDPSEICVLESKAKFGRFGIRSISATVGINWSIFKSATRTALSVWARKKDRHPL